MRWLLLPFLAYIGAVTALAIAVGVRVKSFKPLLWPLHEAVASILVVIGVPVVTALALAGATAMRFSPLFARTLLEWRPGWAWLWGNEEDGVDGLRDNDYANGPWRERTKSWPRWLRVIAWSAFRNPVGNLRFVHPFGFYIDPKRVTWSGVYAPDNTPSNGGGWAFTTCGIYSGLWLIKGKYQLRVGWKLKPEDANGLRQDDYRRKGCGFAFQPWSRR